MEEQNPSGTEQEIRGFLRQIRKRLMIQRGLWYLALYGLVGAGFALLCNLLALWIPLYAGEWIGFAGFGVLLLAGGVHWLCRLPREREAAEAGDRAGLEERLVTSLEGLKKTDLMSRLQRQDTAGLIRNFPVKERMPLRSYPRWYAGMGVCLAAAICCAFLPTDAKKQAAERHALSVVKKEAEKQLDQADKKLEEQAGEGNLAESEKANLQKILQTAKQEIQTSQNQQDIRKAQERMETKLVNSLPKSLDQKTTESLQSLVQNQDLRALADYQQALDQLAQSSETVAGVKQELQSLGKMLDTQQKESLVNQLKQALADGNITQQELAEALQNLQDANASYTQAKLAQASGEASQQPEASPDSAQSAGKDGQQNETGSQTGSQEGNGNNNSNANNNGNGIGNGNNSGSSNGNGGNGNNSSNGSSNGNGNGSGNESGSGNGNGSGSGFGGGYSSGSEQGIQRKEQAGEAEQVWVPQETGDDENLTGQKKGSSAMQRKSGQKETSRAGTKADLNAVSGSYEKKAYSKIQKQKIPDSMEDLVKKYFSSLD